MPNIYLDFGNADAKWYDGDKKFGHFRHAIAPLTDNQWNSVAGRSKTPPHGYIKVNGLAYAVGDAARRHTIKQRPSGAARYNELYYGVGLAMALTEAFNRSSRMVKLFATHAPQDIDYAPDLQRAAMGEWNILCEHGELNFVVQKVETLDEPLGGLFDYVLTKKGFERKENPIRDETVLILDIGGYTVDVVAVDPGGKIDLTSLRSTRTGIIQLKENFERELRSNNRQMFKDSGDLDQRRIEAALLNGFYKFGNKEIDCIGEGTAAIQVLVNDIKDIIRHSGGEANYDVVLLTGGGAALLHAPLRRELSRIDMLLVEDNMDLIRYANVFGAAKLFTMLQRTGVL